MAHTHKKIALVLPPMQCIALFRSPACDITDEVEEEEEEEEESESESEAEPEAAPQVAVEVAPDKIPVCCTGTESVTTTWRLVPVDKTLKNETVTWGTMFVLQHMASGMFAGRQCVGGDSLDVGVVGVEGQA